MSSISSQLLSQTLEEATRSKMKWGLISGASFAAIAAITSIGVGLAGVEGVPGGLTGMAVTPLTLGSTTIPLFALVAGIAILLLIGFVSLGVFQAFSQPKDTSLLSHSVDSNSAQGGEGDFSYGEGIDLSLYREEIDEMPQRIQIFLNYLETASLDPVDRSCLIRHWNLCIFSTEDNERVRVILTSVRNEQTLHPEWNRIVTYFTNWLVQLTNRETHV